MTRGSNTPDGRRSVLLVGGDLCRRVAAGLDPLAWSILGLRRHPTPDPRIRWIQADLTAPGSLRGLPSDITHVLYAPAPDSRDRASYQAAYSSGVKHLLDVLPQAGTLHRFVLVGSTVVWPPATVADPDRWVDETTPVSADNFRSEAILDAEQTLLAQLPEQGVALRLGGIYGPGRTRLLNGLRDGQITAPTGVGHWSNRIHIDDAASACVHLLQLHDPPPNYIGTDGHPTDTLAFYDQLADLLRVPHPRRRAMPPSGKRLSNARLLSSGWSPRWPDSLAGYRSILSSQ